MNFTKTARQACLALSLLALSPAWAQSSIQPSPVDANVAAQGDFERLLRRDLLAYFRAADNSDICVEWKLLREGPTQTGIAYPKFYAWVEVSEGGSIRTRGAARLAAVDRTHFEVTTFLGTAQINAHPDAVARVFPAPLVADIQARAAAAR